MPRNGSGTYSLPAGNPVVTGTVISSTVQNNTTSDIATALTQSLAYDGQTVPIANLPMATYRHTGVGNAVNRTDYASAAQVQDSALIWCGTAGGTANALTLSVTPSISAYAVGQRFVFKSGASANTGATTVNISSVGAIAIQSNGSALVGGEIAANRWYSILVDTASTCQLSKVGISTLTELGITTFAQTILDDANASAARTTLELAYASQAEAEAASSLLRVISPGNAKWLPNSVKFFVLLDVSSGTPSALADYNLSSTTDNGAGDYTLNLINAFSSANFVAIATAGPTNDSARNDSIATIFATTASTIRVRLYDVSAAALYDGLIAVIAFGDQ